MENTDKMPEEATTVLPHPKALVPESLNEVNVMFMAPVENGYFKPVPDKRNTPSPLGSRQLQPRSQEMVIPQPYHRPHGP